MLAVQPVATIARVLRRCPTHTSGARAQQLSAYAVRRRTSGHLVEHRLGADAAEAECEAFLVRWRRLLIGALRLRCVIIGSAYRGLIAKTAFRCAAHKMGNCAERDQLDQPLDVTDLHTATNTANENETLAQSSLRRIGHFTDAPEADAFGRWTNVVSGRKQEGCEEQGERNVVPFHFWKSDLWWEHLRYSLALQRRDKVARQLGCLGLLFGCHFSL